MEYRVLGSSGVRVSPICPGSVFFGTIVPQAEANRIVHTALEESLRAFDDLVRAGKVRAIGLSNYPAWQVVEALWIADRRNLSPIVCVQTLYNLLDRTVEADLMPACARHGLSLVPYSPLAGGVLSGKYQAGQPLPPASHAAVFGHSERGRPGHVPLLTERTLGVAQRVGRVAAELGMTAAQASVAWAVSRPGVASVIIGASRAAQVVELVAALDKQHSTEDQERLAAAAAD
jgi:1-deoxyxylulose-5-phosphate synthase